MKFKDLPFWFLCGILIFPVLIILGVISYAVTFGELNVLFWMIIPSILFEEIFETCCYGFSNSLFANFSFVFAFWFSIGAIFGFGKKILG